MSVLQSKTLLLLLSFVLALPVCAGVVPPVTATAGSSFTVNFGGVSLIGMSTTPSQFSPPLGAMVRFSDFVFTDVDTRTRVSFRADISNTSSSPLTDSQVSVLGFDTTPTVLRSGNVASGAFDTIVIRDDLPYLGRVEFCLSDVLNCAGVGGLGVHQGQTGTVYTTLYFQGAGITELTLDRLAVRYQGLTGVPNVYNGIGSPVPEPVVFAVFGAGIALIALRFRLYKTPKGAANSQG